MKKGIPCAAPRVKVKICGITNEDDAMRAVECGADALGFVFYPRSPRAIAPDVAATIIGKLPPFVTSVGVFVDEDVEYIDAVSGLVRLDVIQLHGHEPPEDCLRFRRVIKALRVRDHADLGDIRSYRCSAILLDAYSPEIPGGTGQTFDWGIAEAAVRMGRIILAGGLNPDNVAEAVARVRPYGVDVSSGVEREKGLKDHDKLALFIARAKGLPIQAEG